MTCIAPTLITDISAVTFIAARQVRRHFWIGFNIILFVFSRKSSFHQSIPKDLNQRNDLAIWVQEIIARKLSLVIHFQYLVFLSQEYSVTGFTLITSLTLFSAECENQYLICLISVRSLVWQEKTIANIMYVWCGFQTVSYTKKLVPVSGNSWFLFIH